MPGRKSAGHKADLWADGKSGNHPPLREWPFGMDGLISDPVRNKKFSSLVPECFRMNWVLFIFDDEDKIKYKWIVLNYEYRDTYII